jgi:hypothetical protein
MHKKVLGWGGRVICLLIILLQITPQAMALSDAQKTVFGLGINYFDINSCSGDGSTTTSTPIGSGPTDKSYTDASRSNRAVGATIYLPSDGQPHPLVIFAPGQNQNSKSDFYKRYLQATANAGFVVAGANFSDNNSSAAIPAEAADIKFLIGQIQQDSDFKSRLNAGAPVGVIGHSDGGIAALIAGYGAGPGQQDDRIGAVIEQDGALYTGQAYKKGSALLIMHGSADTIEPAASAFSVNTAITAPYKAFTEFNGADHNSYITGQPSAQDSKSYAQFNGAVDTLTKAFLDRELNNTKNNGTSLSKIITGQYPRLVSFSESGDENIIAGQSATATTVAATTSSSSCCSGSGDLSGGTLPASVPAPYNAIFTNAAQSTGTDPLILASIFLSEHGYSFPNPPPPYGTGPAWASSAYASGPFQFIPLTWVTYGQGGDIQDLKTAAGAAARYILPLGARAGIPLGSLATSVTDKPSVANVLGSYNAGSAANFPTITETSNYITKGLEAYTKMKNGQDPTTSGSTGGGVATPVVDSAASSGASSCGGDAAVAGNIIQTAEHFAWDTFTGHTSLDSARPEYKAAWTRYDKASDMTDCSAFVATVMISAGIDVNYPKAGTSAQMAYVKSHPDQYQIIDTPTSTAQLKPGDILIHDTGGDGHTLIYIGDSKWQGADASLGGHTPQISPNISWMFTQPNDIAVRILKGGSGATQPI